VAFQQSGLLGITCRSPLYSIYPSFELTVHSLEQWVSVKITKAERTDQSRELQALRALAQYSSVYPGFEYIVRLLDDFLLKGPNGCHQCLVFDLLRPTLNTMVDDVHHFRERLETDIIIRVSTQILKAVDYMHEAGYAHVGTVACSRVFSRIRGTFTSLEP
jgi:serine/threonine protein kinase